MSQISKWWAPVVFTALFLFHTRSAEAEPHITGTADALQIEARESSLEEMLNILAARFGLHYRTKVAIDRLVTGTYKGSLQQVVAQLLKGFDYVAKTDTDTVEFIIFREASPGRAVQVPIVTRRRAD